MDGKIQACGPWVFLKVDPKPTMSATGRLYLPDGNLEQRLGRATGTVLSVGGGKPTKKGRQPSGLKPGDHVMFRGFLQEIHKPEFLDREHCLIHMDDVDGIVEE